MYDRTGTGTYGLHRDLSTAINFCAIDFDSYPVEFRAMFAYRIRSTSPYHGCLDRQQICSWQLPFWIAICHSMANIGGRTPSS